MASCAPTGRASLKQELGGNELGRRLVVDKASDPFASRHARMLLGKGSLDLKVLLKAQTGHSLGRATH